MDNLTHTLFALTLSRTGVFREGRGVTPTLLLAANIPDIEVLSRVTGDRLAYLEAHRGPTHGPGGLLLGFATAALVWLFQWLRRDSRPDRTPFASLLVAGLAGVVGHVAMDFPTSYGTRILSPFVDAWFGADWMPIVDVPLLVVLAAGLIAIRYVPRLRVRIAVATLALMIGNYGFHALLHEAALQRAIDREARVTDGAASSRPSFVFSYAGPGRPAQLPAALPTLTSPFHWRLITRAQGGFTVTEINLLAPAGADTVATRALNLDTANAMDGLWFPDDRGPLVDAAARAAVARAFLRFSRFPSAEVMSHRNGDVTVHWYDMRFGYRIDARGEDRRRHTSPFGAWVRLSPAGEILRQGLGPG